MLSMSLVVAVTLAAEPCEPTRVRETAPLVAAMAQDKVLGLSFTKVVGVCAERGEACEQARLECAAMLTATIQRQVGFDEGQCLREGECRTWRQVAFRFRLIGPLLRG